MVDVRGCKWMYVDVSGWRGPDTDSRGLPAGLKNGPCVGAGAEKFFSAVNRGNQDQLDLSEEQGAENRSQRRA